MKKIIFYIICLFFITRLISMGSPEATHLLVRAIEDQGSRLSYATSVENEHMKWKAHQMLENGGDQFRSKIIQELGPIREIEQLDITQLDNPKVKHAKKFVGYIDEEINEFHNKQNCNERLLALVMPCHNNCKFEGTFLANVLFNTVGFTGTLIGSNIVSSTVSQKPWWNCFFPAEDSCTQDPSAYNCSQLFPCCDNYASALCQPIKDSLYHLRLHRWAITFVTGISALCFLQLLIQLVRVKFIKPHNPITSDTIEAFTEYKRALELENRTTQVQDA